MKVLTIAVALFLVMGYASANEYELRNPGDTSQFNGEHYIVLDGDDYAECPSGYAVSTTECQALANGVQAPASTVEEHTIGGRPRGCSINVSNGGLYVQIGAGGNKSTHDLICKMDPPPPQYQLSNRHTGDVCTPAADVDLAAYMSDKPVPYLTGNCLIEQV